MSDTTSVQVALRVRPLVPSEISRGCKNALQVYKKVNQVRISDKAFTFNHVFDAETTQSEFYEQSVQSMIPNLFKGYNLTILAYGQTGSGKTHSMGTAYNGQGEMGIIPRAVTDIFKHISDNFSYDFTVHITFVELYQEVLYDLLSNKPRDQCTLDIREDANKSIFIPGLTEVAVNSVSETFECLQRGSKGRATSSTNMNAQSSRSHAIFTINISMSPKNNSSDCKTAKFHLVDLAGSERSKKTGATGQTFKEGVNINKGLLALGNVICALGDEKGAPNYVNFRESSLTRLLKDSLGGNSITVMVACVSCADYNVEETLSTLRYADRAKQIKNKPIVNEDPHKAEVGRLHKMVQQLKLELMARDGGALPTIVKQDESLKKEINELQQKLHAALSHNAALNERVMLMQMANDDVLVKFQGLQNQYEAFMANLNTSLEAKDLTAIESHVSALKTIETHFSDINNHHEQHQADIKNHERLEARNMGPISSSSISEEDLGERQVAHTAKQFEMTVELQKVTQILAQKEQLAKQMASNATFMITAAEMAANECKIAELEKEKAELLQLKTVQNNGASSKLAEQRRKRVQELEGQLRDLHRKVQEQARLIKLKEQDQEKIKKLNVEIKNMKSEKIKLIRAMRQESDQFRKWKMNREREVTKLQKQDIKRQNEIVQMKRKHVLQENVWKRKLEEAAANSKRLKDALALRKNVQDSKMKDKVERLKPWLQQELHIHAHLVVAKATCDSLLEDRAALQTQLDELDVNQEDYDTHKQQLNEQIELRSLQIQELQQKIIENDDEEKGNERFANVQTMADAKYSLKTLFELSLDFKRAELEKEHKLDEQLKIHEEMQKTIKKLEESVSQMENKQKEELMKVEQDYEEKLLLLLKQLRGVHLEGADVASQERIAAQESMIENLENVIVQLQGDKDEMAVNIANLTATVNELQASLARPATPPKRKKRSNNDKENTQYSTPPPILDTDVSFVDDVETDPDWRKTPLGKQVRALRDTKFILHNTTKRNSEGGCGCTSNCDTRRCSCKKYDKECRSNCKCRRQICLNRSEQPEIGNDSIIEIKSDEDEGNFKKPSP